MPKIHVRDGASSVDEIIVEFEGKKRHFDDLCTKTRELIETILAELHIHVQSVQHRVKDREKLSAKYSKPDKDYRRLGDIPDIVGLRIITYYSDDIDRVAEVLRREFGELGQSDDKRNGSLESFGYSALHLDCAYSEPRASQSEYKRFAGTRFEIQITTLLGHAWAEMHHGPYDSGDSPREEERRFFRLAALLELADQEFLEIRKARTARERIASVRVAAEAPEVPITAESLRAFIEQKAIVATLDQRLAECFGISGSTELNEAGSGNLEAAVKSAGITTIEQLESKLNQCADAVAAYARACKMIWTAAGQVAPETYNRGFCIAHLANFLMASKGQSAFRKHLSALRWVLPPQGELELQVSAAVKAAADHRLSEPGA